MGGEIIKNKFLYRFLIQSLTFPIGLGALLLILLSCQGKGVNSKGPHTPFLEKQLNVKENSVVARVNDQAITHADVEQLLRDMVPRFSGHHRLSETRMGEFYEQAVEELIDKYLILQEGERIGIEVGAEEIDGEVQKIIERFPTNKDFRKALTREGLTEEQVRLGVTRHLLIEKTINKKIKSGIFIEEGDLELYYKGHKEQFVLPDQVRLRQILLRVNPSASAQEWEEVQQRALSIAQEARAEGNFPNLAQRYSDDEETRNRGGDIGYFHRGQLTLKSVEDVAFGLEVGEVSDPIQTFLGFFIIRLEGRNPQRQLEFSEVNRTLLHRELYRSAFVKRKEDWLKDLKEGADIKKF